MMVDTRVDIGLSEVAQEAARYSADHVDLLDGLAEAFVCLSDDQRQAFFANLQRSGDREVLHYYAMEIAEQLRPPTSAEVTRGSHG